MDNKILAFKVETSVVIEKDGLDLIAQGLGSIFHQMGVNGTVYLALDKDSVAVYFHEGLEKTLPDYMKPEGIVAKSCSSLEEDGELQYRLSVEANKD